VFEVDQHGGGKEVDVLREKEMPEIGTSQLQMEIAVKCPNHFYYDVISTRGLSCLILIS
jgi:hypothetical protein